MTSSAEYFAKIDQRRRQVQAENAFVEAMKMGVGFIHAEDPPEIRNHYERALDELKNLHPRTDKPEWDFFAKMIDAYSEYCQIKELDE